MRLDFLHEGLPQSPPAVPDTALFRKQADPGRPEKSGDSGNETLPRRSGNQNTPMKPRHRKFFNAPKTSLEAGDAEDEPVTPRERPIPVDGDNF